MADIREDVAFARAFAIDSGIIVFEDEDLLVVAKPAGLSSQASDPAHPDDVVTCLTALLEARDGVRPSLGVHQRLDRETSGVMVFAKTPRANKSLATQFEARTVEKAYVACVRGGPNEPRTLVHQLSERTGGRVTVAPPGQGKKAVTRVVPIERKGDRALFGLRIETGRTHQIRVQLAASGCPVAGDAEYEGPPAPRLMLHAASLTIRHPADERVLKLNAPVPRSFKRYLEGADAYALDDARSLREALERACTARLGAFHARDDARATDVFRLLHGSGDGTPGLFVDVYGEHLVVQLASDEAFAAEAVILDAMKALGPRGIYLKRRPKKASDVVTTRSESLAPSEPVHGDAAPDPMIVREHGIAYPVRLGDGLGTGLYLDQRDNRRRVIALSAEKRVLNLFAYACAFSMAAARGSAQHVTSVDVSAPALERGANALASSFPDIPHEVLQADVFAMLANWAREGRTFDLVICDPPTYATTRASRWTSGDDWRGLVAQIARVLAPEGVLVATSNDQRIGAARFRKLVELGMGDVKVTRVRTYDPPRDFPVGAGGEPHLKTVVLSRS